MAKKPVKDLIVMDADGTLYVQLRVIMSPLCALVDGLPLTFFSKRKNAKAYMTVAAAIEWCRNEMNYHSRAKYAALIEKLEALQQQAVVEQEEARATSRE